MKIFSAVLVAGVLVAGSARASWLSDITGINIDVPGGKLEIGRPNLNAIPRMLQNLPKDAAQFFLNPGGNALALAIRHAKAQASYGCRPIPPQVIQSLSRFLPPQFYSGVCWNTPAAARIALDNLLLRHLGNGAVTLEDVVVFQNDAMAQDVPLWAHELAHVQQYRRLGLETFAHVYMFNFPSMEAEANQLQNMVASRYKQQGTGNYYTVAPQAFGAPIPTQAYQQAARQVIPPGNCAVWQEQPGQLSIQNPCPVPIVMTSFSAQNLANGAIVNFPCPANCIIAARSRGGFAVNRPWSTRQVFFRW